MGLYMPLFGGGKRIWRPDADVRADARSPTDEELDAAIPGWRLAFGEFADDSLARARRGAIGAAQVVVEEYRSRGIPITLDAARERVGRARTRADNQRN